MTDYTHRLERTGGSKRSQLTTLARSTFVLLTILSISATSSLARAGTSATTSTWDTATVAASDFAAGHMGTQTDPYPSRALVDAVASLPPEGGTVVLAGGVWLVDAIVSLEHDNLHLKGESLDTHLLVVNRGSLYLHNDADKVIANLQISGLTIDASDAAWDGDDAWPLHLRNCDDCKLVNLQIIGHPNPAHAAVLLEGGNRYDIRDNSFLGTSGGMQLQINPLYNSDNTGSVVAHNTFDSTAVLVIGQNDFLMEGNLFHNESLGNAVGPLIAPAGGTLNRRIVIRNNIIDALRGSWNDAVLGGVPQDPGLQGSIDGFVIVGNVIRGAVSVISPTSPVCDADCTETAHVSNVEIINNQLQSMWDGSSIDLRGGIDGSVDTVRVENNTLIRSGTRRSRIRTDANTYNATILDNSFAVARIGGSSG